jgi:hypothetical protein
MGVAVFSFNWLRGAVLTAARNIPGTVCLAIISNKYKYLAFISKK